MERTTRTGGAPGARERAAWITRTSGNGQAVLMMDVEQITLIRRRHGARLADGVTRLVLERIGRALRPHDRLACVRDDELMVVLGGAETQSLPGIEVRLRRVLHHLRVVVDGEVWTLSCILGRSARVGSQGTFDSLVRAADHSLWQIKGQNRAGD